MATPKSQRIGIWVIALILIVASLGSFFAMILSNQNNAADSAKLQKMETEYQSNVAAQTKELSDKYYPEFSKYASTPAAFDATSVKTLTTNDLLIGDGTEIKSDTKYNAYYIGWNPSGLVFQQSINNGTLSAPVPGGGMIDGWNEGVIGMKMGGVRELSIPSDKAYAETGNGENIPPNTPLKFIVMVIPSVADVAMPDALLQYYQSQYSGA